MKFYAERKQEKRAAWLRSGNIWDSPSPGRDLPSNIKYMVVDVETHDWGDNCIGRVVEIAWMLYDSGGNKLESKQYLLRPYAEYGEISTKARRYHGINTTCAKELGSDSTIVFAEFARILMQVPNDGFVIAHNMKHEDKLFQDNLSVEQAVIWDRTPKCDTICKSLLKYLPGGNPYGNRKYGLKLADLHKECFRRMRDNGSDSQHEALADVKMTWEIFDFYKRRCESANENTRSVLKWQQG